MSERTVEITEKKLSWAAVGVMITMVVNLFALVWGAATISAGLTQAQVAIQDLKTVGTALTESLNGLTGRVGILETRVEILKDEIQQQRR